MRVARPPVEHDVREGGCDGNEDGGFDREVDIQPAKGQSDSPTDRDDRERLAAARDD